MRFAEHNQGQGCPDQRQEHVSLGIPNIPLGAQELACRLPQDKGAPPFEQFVDGAEGQANANDQEGQPPALSEGRPPF